MMMKKRVKFFGFVVVLIAALMPRHAQTQTKSKQVETFLKNAMLKEHIPGLAFSVIEKGKVVGMGALGKANLSWGADVDLHTTFQIASVSKIFCGVLLARLFDEQILTPGQKLSTLIDTIPATWKDITVLQLAAHQSGIKMASFGTAKNTKHAVELAKEKPMEFFPGEASSYISSDYWILQYIIEKKTGLKYFDALKKYVLDPLEMKDTYVNYTIEGMARTSDVLPKEATVYHYSGNNNYRVGDFPFGSTGYSAGGIFTSISDFSKLALALDGRKFINAESYKLLTNNITLNSGKPGSFGMGFIVRDYEGHKIVEHSGGPALADFVRFEEEGITIIVLSNQRGFYPYLSKALATLFITDLQMPHVPR